MKINNKGFMLVEIVVVTVVVVTIMTSLYIVFNRVYNAFEIKSTYSDINAIYALDLLRDYMIEKETTNSFIYNDLVKRVQSENYIEITCDIDEKFNTYCTEVFENYNINRVFITKNNAESLRNLKNISINQTFKEYIDYLTNTLNFENSEGEILLAETYTVPLSSSDDETTKNEKKNTFNKYAYLTGTKN